MVGITTRLGASAKRLIKTTCKLVAKREARVITTNTHDQTQLIFRRVSCDFVVRFCFGEKDTKSKPDTASEMQRLDADGGAEIKNDATRDE
jgi:hypothetical protein